MKKLVVFLFSLFIFFPVVNAEERIEVSLIKCVDGDTAIFFIDEEEKKFRFLAIDTPETLHPTRGEESGGKLASEYTCELLESAKKIEVLYDEKGTKTDKYGRELAWIYVDDKLLQELLVSDGYAEIAYVYYKYNFIDNLCNVQQEAIKNKLGIWSDGTREEGYCKTKSNSTTTTKTTNKKDSNEQASTKGLTENQEKIVDYILDGKYDKALEVIIDDTTSVVILSILLFLLILFRIFKK